MMKMVGVPAMNGGKSRGKGEKIGYIIIYFRFRDRDLHLDFF